MVRIKIAGILFLILNVCLVSRDVPLFLRADYPKMLVKGEAFEISLISRVLKEDIDSVGIRIIIPAEMRIEEIFFRNFEVTKELDFIKELPVSNDEVIFMVNLSKWEFDLHTAFQILYRLQPGQLSEADIDFAFELYSTGRLIDGIDRNRSRQELFGELKPIKFYDKKTNAGKAARLEGNAALDLTLRGSRSTKYLIQFWASAAGEPENFANIISAGDTLLSFSKDKFDYLDISGAGEQAAQFERVFLSDKCWHFFAIGIDRTDQKAEIYVDDRKIFEDRFAQFTMSNDIFLSFTNGTEKSKVSLDMLIIWNFGGSLDQIFSNKYYKVFSSDSSGILAYIDFDNKNTTNSLNTSNGIEIESDKLQSENSDAPVFSRSPQVKFSIQRDLFTLEWESHELNSVEVFEVEKSTDGGEFFNIQTIPASDEPKVYIFTDYRDPNFDLVYYRIKQINRDGSAIYSGITKIGQGNQEDFSSLQNYPNPFNPVTTISLEVIIGGDFYITIYDIVGNEITDLHSGYLGEGIHTFIFDGSNLPSGIYFYEVKSVFSSRVQKMILTK